MARPVLVLFGVALLLVVGCSDDGPADYDSAFRDDFLSRCADAFGPTDGQQVCACWYDSVSEAVAFEDLPPIDDLVGNNFDQAATRLPGGAYEIPLEILATCVRTLGAEATIPATTVPLPLQPRPTPPPTTVTTVPA